MRSGKTLRNNVRLHMDLKLKWTRPELLSITQGIKIKNYSYEWEIAKRSETNKDLQ